jgi:hypothetical protein
MIKLKSLLNEESGWKKYNSLTHAQKKALYEYMVTSGGVGPEEYNDHVKKYEYKIVIIDAKKIAPILDKGGWDWMSGINPDDEKRINAIDRLIKKTNQKWPYIVSGATSFKQWAENEYYHGDGFHRMLLSVRKNEPIEFLFLKEVR